MRNIDTITSGLVIEPWLRHDKAWACTYLEIFFMLKNFLYSIVSSVVL